MFEFFMSSHIFNTNVFARSDNTCNMLESLKVVRSSQLQKSKDLHDMSLFGMATRQLSPSARIAMEWHCPKELQDGWCWWQGRRLHRERADPSKHASWANGLEKHMPNQRNSGTSWEEDLKHCPMLHDEHRINERELNRRVCMKLTI